MQYLLMLFIKMNKMKPDISLFIFDIHNTICDLWDRWGEATLIAFEALSRSREIDMEILLSEARKQPPQYRFHDFRGLIERMDILHPLQPEDQQISAQWMNLKQKITAYPGVLDTFTQIQRQGGKVVLYTDSPAETALCETWRMRGMNPDMLDGLYTQPTDELNFSQIPEPIFLPDELDSWMAYYQYKNLFSEKLYMDLPVRPNTPPNSEPVAARKKPNLNALNFICQTQGIPPDQTLLIDDNANAALQLPEGLRFAVQKAGNMLCETTLWLHNEKLNDPGYVIGWEATHAKLLNHGIQPEAILENGVPEILDRFNILPAPVPCEHPRPTL